jgi:hypothetical protein
MNVSRHQIPDIRSQDGELFGSLPLKDVLMHLAITNPRFRLEGMSKSTLRSKYIRLSTLLSTGTLSQDERALLILLWGCAISGTRLEEFTGSVTEANVHQFFFIKMLRYSELIGDKPNHLNSIDTVKIIKLCRDLRSKVSDRFIETFVFYGSGPRIEERFEDYQLELMRWPAINQLPIIESDRRSGFILHNLVEVVEGIIGALRVVGSDYDIIVITMPRFWNLYDLDVDEFRCYISADYQGRFSYLARKAIQARMIRHKRKERQEVRSPGYRKPYTNLSAYVWASRQVRGHAFVGINHAIRYILDISTPMGIYWGMADIRIARVKNETPFTKQDLGNLFAAGKNLESMLSTALRHLVPSLDS